LEPTLVVTQGAWAVDGRPPLVDRLRLALEAEGKCLLSNKSNGKYGLYEFPRFRLITSHHPARLGVWKSQYAQDSLRPMIDYLKADGYLPRVAPEDADQFERLVKPPVDRMLAQMPAEYRF
jgi:hypothetical protein